MRRKDWPERLMATLDSLRGQPFAWGRNDCCLFAAACIQAVTGLDVAGSYRGRYASEEEALALTGGDVQAFVARMAQQHGFAEISPARAMRGDVCLAEMPAGLCVGIVLGPRVAAQGKAGLVFLPRGCVRRAWRVG